METAAGFANVLDRCLAVRPGELGDSKEDRRQNNQKRGELDQRTLRQHKAPGRFRTLVGRPLDDDGMLDVLAPYAPHRHRVVRLVEMSGARKPPSS